MQQAIPPFVTGLWHKFLRMIVASILLFLNDCAPRPLYQPPPDPYGLDNVVYQQIRPTIEEGTRRSCDTNKWYTETAEEKQRNAAAFSSLGALCKSGHIPSLTLMANFFICEHDGYFGSGGYNGRYGKYYRAAANKAGLNKSKMDQRYLKFKQDGLAMLRFAAMFGFEYARQDLRRLGESVPEATLETREQRQARYNYQQQVQSYELKQREAGEALGAAAIGLAIAAAGGRGSSTVSRSAPSDRSNNDPDVQGCCSFHGGVLRDQFGKVACNFGDMVRCNDGDLSPTCVCGL